jgi:hypothetical protein
MRLAASASIATVDRPRVKTTAKRERNFFMVFNRGESWDVQKVDPQMLLKKQGRDESRFCKT